MWLQGWRFPLFTVRAQAQTIDIRPPQQQRQRQRRRACAFGRARVCFTDILPPLDVGRQDSIMDAANENTVRMPPSLARRKSDFATIV
jgi:hypothetical protein